MRLLLPGLDCFALSVQDNLTCLLLLLLFECVALFVHCLHSFTLHIHYCVVILNVYQKYCAAI